MSDTKHDIGRPTRSTEAWNWVATTDAQYKAVIAPLVQIDVPALLPATHPLTKRLQMWLDKVDAQLRASNPQALAGVPKPQAKVVVDGTANAFVAPAAVCYRIPIKVGAAAATAASTRDRVFVDVSTGDLSDFPDELSCIDGGANAANLTAFAAQFNAASRACKFQFIGGKLVPSAACKIDPTIAGTAAGRSVVILQTANWVTVHTGIIPLMNEDAFVAVISHELGHYYRSHMTAHESLFGFYYTLDRLNPTSRPVPDLALKRQGDAAFAAAEMLSSGDTFVPVQGQRLRSELFAAAGSLVRRVAADPASPAECRTAATFLKSAAFVTASGKLPFAASASSANAYRAFEAQVRPCLAKLKVLTGSAAAGGTGASWAAFRREVEEPSFPAFMLSLPATTRASISKAFAKLDTRLTAAPAVGTTFDRALDAASRTLDAQETAGANALRTAHNQRIGQYTIEQEADEESAEWIAKLGFNPHAAVDAMDALVKGEDTSLGGLSLGQTDCEALAARNWLDAAGSYQFVPVGNYAEIHHSTCYRMFNLTREIEAHHEVSSGAALPAHDGQAWVDLQAVAKQLSGSLAPRRRSPIGRIVQTSHAFECVYAERD